MISPFGVEHGEISKARGDYVGWALQPAKGVHSMKASGALVPNGPKMGAGPHPNKKVIKLRVGQLRHLDARLDGSMKATLPKKGKKLRSAYVPKSGKQHPR